MHKRSLYSSLLILLCIGFLLVTLNTCKNRTDEPFTISGKSFTKNFSEMGPLSLQKNETVLKSAAVTLFDDMPEQEPPCGTIILPSTSIGISSRLTNVTTGMPALPMNGSATVHLWIAPGQQDQACNDAVMLAEFKLSFTMNIATVLREAYSLTREALAAIIANDVTICVETESNFDGQITIGEYYLAFGSEYNGIQTAPPFVPTLAPPSGLMQVPIDNAGGKAVKATTNKIIGAVRYAVVGVIEDQTPEVSSTPGEPGSITIDLADLGLRSVATIYIGTHSSYVADVANGVTLATLTIEYDGGINPTTLDFVTGSTTAEWSYDRPEHMTAYGGVQHGKAPVLYSFETDIASGSLYNGYSYGITIPVDSNRTVSSISIKMANPSAYTGLRLAADPLSKWAHQAVSAITLVGLPIIIEEEKLQACCGAEGECEMASRLDCYGMFGKTGIPQGEGTNCETVECKARGPKEVSFCCYPGRMTISREYVETCDASSDYRNNPQLCLEHGGVPVVGTLKDCLSDNIDCDFDFWACCDPNSDDCYDFTYDYCIAQGWEPWTGINCADIVVMTTYGPTYDQQCPVEDDLQGCCFDSGHCEDVDPDTCILNGGTPGGKGTECDYLECLGACCKPDGCCQLASLDDCETAGGGYQGFAVDCTPDPCPDLYTCYSISNHPDFPSSSFRSVETACTLMPYKLLSDYPGGGNDPRELAVFLDDILPGKTFTTSEEAAAECCIGLTDFKAVADYYTAKAGGVTIGLDPFIKQECKDIGACCHAKGCTEASEDDCNELALDSAFGPVAFQGVGTNCDEVVCPECFLIAGTCSTSEQSAGLTLQYTLQSPPPYGGPPIPYCEDAAGSLWTPVPGGLTTAVVTRFGTWDENWNGWWDSAVTTCGYDVPAAGILICAPGVVCDQKCVTIEGTCTDYEQSAGLTLKYLLEAQLPYTGPSIPYCEDSSGTLFTPIPGGLRDAEITGKGDWDENRNGWWDSFVLTCGYDVPAGGFLKIVE